jgi:hypothetical protein
MGENVYQDFGGFQLSKKEGKKNLVKVTIFLYLVFSL